MSGWVLASGLAIAAFLTVAVLFKTPRRGWGAIGAALLLGIAGYALQGSPGQPGAPRQAQAVFSDGSAMVTARQALSVDGSAMASSWQVIADGMARRGQYGNAAEVLRGATRANPQDAQAWLAMGNALVAHAGGNLTPAALIAFRRAAAVAPDHPGPPFFLGLALAQNGQLGEGRALWADLLAKAPADAPWRVDLAKRLAALDAYIAGQQARPAR
jgi:cytochrome c-type biogenesis protein CcmH